MMIAARLIPFVLGNVGGGESIPGAMRHFWLTSLRRIFKSCVSRAAVILLWQSIHHHSRARTALHRYANCVLWRRPTHQFFNSVIKSEMCTGFLGAALLPRRPIHFQHHTSPIKRSKSFPATFKTTTKFYLHLHAQFSFIRILSFLGFNRSTYFSHNCDNLLPFPQKRQETTTNEVEGLFKNPKSIQRD